MVFANQRQNRKQVLFLSILIQSEPNQNLQMWEKYGLARQGPKRNVTASQNVPARREQDLAHMVKIESIIRFTDEPKTEGNGCFVSGQRNQNENPSKLFVSPTQWAIQPEGFGQLQFCPSEGEITAHQVPIQRGTDKKQAVSFVFLFGKKRIKFKYISNISLIHPNQE